MAVHAPITGALARAPLTLDYLARLGDVPSPCSATGPLVAPVPPFSFAIAHRAAIEAEIERLIALLDASDGDSDSELDGDEQDGSFSEDDFVRHGADGPGCPLSDPGGALLGQRVDDTEDDEDDETAARRPFARMIQRTRCIASTDRLGTTTYELPDPPADATGTAADLLGA